MKNIVYITTNIVNGKQYIGSHKTENVDDGYLGSGTIIKNAIKKHGKENFRRELLIECDNIDKARDLEASYIKEYNTLSPNGYNISPTGGTTRLGKHSKKTIQILRDKNKGKNNPWYGKSHSDEAREKMSFANIGRTPTNLDELHTIKTRRKISATLKKKFQNNEIENGMTGKNHSEEARKKISEAAKKQRGPRGPYKKKLVV